jgi:dihydroneopterin aldolase
MGIIEIEGMEFYAFHGHYAEEQIVGNKFLIDLRIETDCKAAGKTDDIHDALNYQTAYKIVAEQMKNKSYLLEHLAQRILDALFLNLSGIHKASVKVSKLNPPMGGKIEKVSVTLMHSL